MHKNASCISCKSSELIFMIEFLHPLLIHKKVFFLPSSFGNDHFCATFVELIPEILLLKSHFRIVLNIVILRKRHSWGHPSKGEAW